MIKYMKINPGNHGDFPKFRSVKPFHKYTVGAIFLMGAITVVTILVGIVGVIFCTSAQMYLIWPLLASGAIYITFCYLLWFRIRSNIFGEIGFIYLGFVLAYTILPCIKFLELNFDFPQGFDTLNFSSLSPQPSEIGAHTWRHVLFIFGVAAGYLAIRGRESPLKRPQEISSNNNNLVIGILLVVIACCISAATLLSSSVTTYIEHYTRYNHLSWLALRFVYACLILKGGGYFVVLALMFSQYHRYRVYIFIFVLAVCTYEISYSFGSRIEALMILLASVGFYHFKVSPISIKKGITYLIALAFIFSVVETVRTAIMENKSIQATVATEGLKSASEFGSVFYTGFHLYSERKQGHIPPRDWQMFFYEFVEMIPFVDHTIYHPQYWYARHYFPEAVVPPQTMGVIADSAIWGGELDLLIRSLINGALFALIARWFFRRQEEWWTLTIYVYCYATCILTLKYSVFYQLIPFVRILLPVLIFTGVLFHTKKVLARIKSHSAESVV